MLLSEPPAKPELVIEPTVLPFEELVQRVLGLENQLINKHFMFTRLRTYIHAIDILTLNTYS